jgi:hypothetical protein
MFDSESLRPIIIAMVLFLVLVNVLPKVLKEPTDIKPVDDLVMLCVTLRGFMMPGSLLVAIIVYATNYINGQVL